MKNYIPSLNGLRALSIIIVILGHLNLKSFGGISLPFPLALFVDGAFGVNVFFVISGFLITTLLIKEEHETGTVSLKNFYLRRIFRIFPAYYFLLLVYFILQLCSVLYFTKGSWLSSIFYYKYLAGGDWESGHFWSLSVEEHFYLAWPLIFLFLRRFRVSIAFGGIIMVVFFRYNAYSKIFPSPMLYLNVSIFQRVDAILIGCLMALYKGRVIPFAEKIRRFTLSPLLIILLLAFLSSGYLTEWNLTHHLHLGFILIPLGIGTSYGLISNLLIALLILISIAGENKWFRFLNTPVLNFIGKLSYSLYLWQEMFVSPRLGFFSRFPVNIVCIFICALVSYYFIEKPFLRIKDRYETLKVRANRVLVPVFVERPAETNL